MPEEPATKADTKRIKRVARCFDATGRLQRWPSRRADQELTLWVIWSQLPGDGQMSELDINAMLRTWHDVEDYVLLRRELIEMDLLRRTPDGGIYRRVSHPVPEQVEQVVARFSAISG